MRIAVSGTHYTGKSTLIEDFIKVHPEYRYEIEPYHQLESTDEPSLDNFLEQLDYSIEMLSTNANERNIIFDRCPVDFLAYAMCALEQDHIDINNSEVSERFSEIKAALDNLDVIVFLPIVKEHVIEYTEDDAAFRKAVDQCFKRLYRDDIYDIFPQYDVPKVIEIWGDRSTRMRKLELSLASTKVR